MHIKSFNSHSNVQTVGKCDVEEEKKKNIESPSVIYTSRNAIQCRTRENILTASKNKSHFYLMFIWLGHTIYGLHHISI